MRPNRRLAQSLRIRASRKAADDLRGPSLLDDGRAEKVPPLARVNREQDLSSFARFPKFLAGGFRFFPHRASAEDSRPRSEKAACLWPRVRPPAVARAHAFP